MILGYLLCSAAALAPLGQHSTLHPANVDVYVEVPDVPTLLQAYEKAPMIQLAQDEGAQKIGNAVGEFGFDLKSLFQEMLPGVSSARSGDPASTTGDALAADGRGISSGLSRLSVSVSGLDREPGASEEITKRIGVFAVFDFSSPEDLTRAFESMSHASWLEKAAASPEPQSTPERIRLGDAEAPVERWRITIATLHLDAWSVRQGQRAVVGAGVCTPAEFAQRIDKTSAGLPEESALFSGEKNFSASAGATVLQAWSDLSSVPFLIEGRPMTGALGMVRDALFTWVFPFVGRRGTWRIQLRGDRFITESSCTHIGPENAVDGLYGAEPVDSASLRLIPKEALGAWTVRMRPASVASFVKTLSLAPADKGEGASATPTELAGLDPMFAALGSGAAIYLLPIASINPPLPRVIVALELKDKTAFEKGLEALVAHIKEHDPNLHVETKPYHKIPITTFSSSKVSSEAETPASFGENIDAQIHPSIVVLVDRVLIGLTNFQLRSEIGRLEKKPAGETEGETHPLAVQGRIPKDAIEASSMDWAGFIAKIYDLARGFLPMMAQGTKLSFDPTSLPTSAALIRFFQPSFSWTKRVDGKTYTYSESSVGPETPLALAVLAMAVVQASQDGPLNLNPRYKKSEPGSSAPPSDDAAQLKSHTLDALRDVKTGLAVYRAQVGRFPVKLELLLEGTESFPKGFLEAKELPKDAWGHALAYESASDGAKYKLWSFGPDGIDQAGGGDDIAVP